MGLGEYSVFESSSSHFLTAATLTILIMNSLTLFPLLIAAAIAAPAGHHAATNPLFHGPQLAYAAAPGLSYAAAPALSYDAAPAVTYTQQVQVPLTKTIHYESKPVVTGYQTTILKPAIPHGFGAPVLSQPAFVAPAPAPVVVEAPSAVVVPEEKPVEVAPAPVQAVQEEPAAAPAPAPAPVEEAAPVQADAADTEVIENPEFRSAGVAEVRAAAAPAAIPAFGGFNYVAGPGAYATYAAAPGAYATYAAAPAATFAAATYAAAPAATFAAATYAAAPVVVKSEAPHFDQLVTKEKVLAPVRTHTQITPQLTQIQPEVTVRKVIHEVPVAQPVAYAHTQYVQQPAFAYSAGPAAYKVHHY